MAQEIKVFIIEDDIGTRNYFAEVIELFFGARVSCTFASGIEDAIATFERLLNNGIDIIFVDACLNSTRPNSMPLVRHIANFYQGPILAMSGNKNFIYPLLEAGCSHHCAKDKFFNVIDEFLRRLPES